MPGAALQQMIDEMAESLRAKPGETPSQRLWRWIVGFYYVVSLIPGLVYWGLLLFGQLGWFSPETLSWAERHANPSDAWEAVSKTWSWAEDPVLRAILAVVFGGIFIAFVPGFVGGFFAVGLGLILVLGLLMAVTGAFSLLAFLWNLSPTGAVLVGALTAGTVGWIVKRLGVRLLEVFGGILGGVFMALGVGERRWRLKLLASALMLAGVVVFLSGISLKPWPPPQARAVVSQPRAPLATPRANRPVATPRPASGLDMAREQIPGTLKDIYAALNDGNPQAVSAVLTADILGSNAELDRMCKPFTYRAHYIESIVERPERRFEARARVLFKPLEEHHYVFTFVYDVHRFVLEKVAWSGGKRDFYSGDHDDSPDLEPQAEAAGTLARKFVYAAMAGERRVMQDLVSPGFPMDEFLDSPAADALREVDRAWDVRPTMRAKGGLRPEVRVQTGRGSGGVCGPDGHLLFDEVKGKQAIVAMRWKGGCGWSRGASFEGQDPDSESYTLKRFKIFGSQEKTAETLPAARARVGEIAEKKNQRGRVGVGSPRTTLRVAETSRSLPATADTDEVTLTPGGIREWSYFMNPGRWSPWINAEQYAGVNILATMQKRYYIHFSADQHVVAIHPEDVGNCIWFDERSPRPECTAIGDHGRRFKLKGGEEGGQEVVVSVR